MMKYNILMIVSTIMLSCTNEVKQVEETEQTTSVAPDKEISIPTDNSIEVFENNCAACHGNDGTAGISGAANLQTSLLQTDSIKKIIVSGKNTMPAFKEILSETQIQQLSNYVKNLHK